MMTSHAVLVQNTTKSALASNTLQLSLKRRKNLKKFCSRFWHAEKYVILSVHARFPPCSPIWKSSCGRPWRLRQKCWVIAVAVCWPLSSHQYPEQYFNQRYRRAYFYDQVTEQNNQLWMPCNAIEYTNIDSIFFYPSNVTYFSTRTNAQVISIISQLQYKIECRTNSRAQTSCFYCNSARKFVLIYR